MNKLISVLSLAILVAGATRVTAQSSLENDPAYLAIDKAIDLKAIQPEVNVNLPRFLLQDALSGFNGGPDDPFAKANINLADLIKEVKLIRLLVIEANPTNRAALDAGVAALRKTLESKWTAVASVPEENVGVYALGDASGEKMAGLALLINDDGDAVIANIVGRVSLAKIIQIATQLDKFPKDILQKLAQASQQGEEKAKAEPVKAGK